jgi:DNA-binding MarR family transcriptional regulator
VNGRLEKPLSQSYPDGVTTTEPGASEPGASEAGATAPGGEAGSEALAEALLATLGLMRRHVRRLVGQPWPQSPMTGSQSELIRLVRRNPGISVAEAAAELGLAANTVSTLVGQLTELGLLRRSPDERDRRIARLSLTPSAQRRVEAWRDRRIALVSQVLNRLDRAEVEALRAALPTLNAVADRLRPAETEPGPEADPEADPEPDQDPEPEPDHNPQPDRDPEPAPNPGAARAERSAAGERTAGGDGAASRAGFRR